MIIPESPRLARQLNGNIVSALMQAIEEQTDKNDLVLAILRNWSLVQTSENSATMWGEYLNWIGNIIGLRRLYLPYGMELPNILTFDEYVEQAGEQVMRKSGVHGLGSEMSADGGFFVSVGTTGAANTVLIPDWYYRTLLQAYAKIKRKGGTLDILADILSVTETGYNVQYDARGDMYVYLNTTIEELPFYVVQVVTELFFSTPHVVIING